jgi:hypothetical protein
MRSDGRFSPRPGAYAVKIKKGDFPMLYTSKKAFYLSIVILAGTLALNPAPARALQDVSDETRPGVVGEIPGAPVSYCHMKFPAIEEGTLGTHHPRLESGAAGDTIDYYGSCDHDPLGRDEVQRQILDDQSRSGSQFND